MRTIQVLNVRWFNATAWYGLFLAKLLRDAGHPVKVITLPDTATHREALEWGMDPLPMALNSSNPLKQPGLMRSLSGLIREFRPDVINCHRGEAFALFGMLRAMRAPLPFALARTRGDQRLPKANFINKFLYASAADVLIATNSRMAAHFTDSMDVPASRVHTIPGGVDEKKFAFDPSGRDRVRREFNIPDNAFTFGLLGRLDPVKGHRDFLRAAGRLARQGLPVRLLILGFDANHTREETQGWIDEEGLREAAFITGKREDIAACLSALDAGVIASKGSETIARAALEIMACGRPILSSNVGVMPDIVSEEALFAPGDIDALAARMLALMSDRRYFSRLGEQQAERLRSLSGPEFLRRTLAAYEDALSRSGIAKA